MVEGQVSEPLKLRGEGLGTSPDLVKAFRAVSPGQSEVLPDGRKIGKRLLGGQDCLFTQVEPRETTRNVRVGYINGLFLVEGAFRKLWQLYKKMAGRGVLPDFTELMATGVWKKDSWLSGLAEQGFPVSTLGYLDIPQDFRALNYAVDLAQAYEEGMPQVMITDSYGAIGMLEYLAGQFVDGAGKLRQVVEAKKIPKVVVLVNSMLAGFHPGAEAYLRASGQLKVNPEWEPVKDETVERTVGVPPAMAELVNNSLYLRHLQRRLQVARGSELFPRIIHIAGDVGQERLSSLAVSPKTKKWGFLGRLARQAGFAHGDGMLELNGALGLVEPFATSPNCVAVKVIGANHADTISQPRVQQLIEEIVTAVAKEKDPLQIIRGQSRAQGNSGSPAQPLVVEGKPTENRFIEAMLLGVMLGITWQQKLSGRRERLEIAHQTVDELNLSWLPQEVQERLRKKLKLAANREEQHQIFAKAVVEEIEERNWKK